MENMSNEAWSRKASGLVKDLLTGLEHLHFNNMLHRDLKVGVCNVINTIITLATIIRNSGMTTSSARQLAGQAGHPIQGYVGIRPRLDS